MDIQNLFKQIKENNKYRKVKKGSDFNYEAYIAEDSKGEILNNIYDISLLIVYGRYSVSLENNNVKMLNGNIILLKRGSKVRYEMEEMNGKLCIINFKKDFFDTQLLSQMADCPILYDFIRLNATEVEYLVFDISSYEIIKTYLRVLLYEVSSLNKKNDKLVKAALVLFLTNLHHVHQETLIIGESSMMRDYDIGSWLKYMADNYSTVTLKSIAETFNFNPTYFSMKFKVLANCQFSEKLLQIKLEKAKWLLSTTNLSVTSIVDIIGFKEKSYFYRVFKKNYNITPLQYRKNRNQIQNLDSIENINKADI